MPKHVQRIEDQQIACVSNEAAKLLVESGKWAYISKAQFKKALKAVRKGKPVETALARKMSKAQRRLEKQQRRLAKRLGKK